MTRFYINIKRDITQAVILMDIVNSVKVYVINSLHS